MHTYTILTCGEREAQRENAMFSKGHLDRLSSRQAHAKYAAYRPAHQLFCFVCRRPVLCSGPIRAACYPSVLLQTPASAWSGCTTACPSSCAPGRRRRLGCSRGTTLGELAWVNIACSAYFVAVGQTGTHSSVSNRCNSSSSSSRLVWLACEPSINTGKEPATLCSPPAHNGRPWAQPPVAVASCDVGARIVPSMSKHVPSLLPRGPAPALQQAAAPVRALQRRRPGVASGHQADELARLSGGPRLLPAARPVGCVTRQVAAVAAGQPADVLVRH